MNSISKVLNDLSIITLSLVVSTFDSGCNLIIKLYLFKSILDSLILGSSVAADGCARDTFGFSEYECDYSKMYRWKLSEYIESTPIEKVKEI